MQKGAKIARMQMNAKTMLSLESEDSKSVQFPSLTEWPAEKQRRETREAREPWSMVNDFLGEFFA